MEDWKKDRVDSAAKGQNPTVLARMKSGFAVIGDTQFLPGYCVLLAYPKVSCLNDLTIKERSEFLTDMTLIGGAIDNICKPIRINYSIYGLKKLRLALRSMPPPLKRIHVVCPPPSRSKNTRYHNSLRGKDK